VSELAGRNVISRKQEEAVTLFETVTGYICKSTAERGEPFSFDVSGTSGRGSADSFDGRRLRGEGETFVEHQRFPPVADWLRDGNPPLE
jgi:hypothetical protein